LSRAPKIVSDLLFRRSYAFDFDYMPVRVSGMSAAQRMNLLRAGLNLGYRRLTPWSWPLNMQVELTSFCNLRCPVCPVGSGELHRPPLSMDPKLLESLLKEVGPYLLTLALWAWGEPLLHPELKECLRIAQPYPAATLLSTNGQNLDRDKVQEAIQAHPPTYLIVAIDGLCDETNSKFRQGAKLAPIMEGVKRLASWKASTGSRLPILHFRFIVMKHNEHELPRLREFAAELGFDMVSVRTLSTIDSDRDTHRDFVPESQEWRAYKYKNDQRVPLDDFICQHAFSYPSVLADGTVVSCDQDHNGSHPYGVFSRQRSFSGIWFGKEARQVRRTIRDSPCDFSFCRNCPFAHRPVSTCSIEGYQINPHPAGE
jgi:MoaA/NifB/PqqE/SkfB family radical SAM enzyme